MALRQIVKIGEEVLREKSKNVVEFDAKLGMLLDDMKETMIKANGVGLAAPQVGILKKVCVVCVDGETYFELVNPEIVKARGTQIGAEGCLSVPGKHGNVARPKKIIVDAQDRLGNKKIYRVSGYAAVAFCHEIDHLSGILFIDKLEEDKAEDD